MEFMLSEEQRMLQESVSGFLASQCPLDRVRSVADAEESIADDVYRGLCELGIPGIVIPADFGGVGMGFLEAAVVAEALGGAVAPCSLYRHLGHGACWHCWRVAVKPKKMSGFQKSLPCETCVAVGVTEQLGRRESDGISAANGKLSGKAMFVLEGMEADAYLIADATGALHIVDGDANGLSRTKLKTIDRTRSVVEISLNATPADVLPDSLSDREPLLCTIDAGRLMLAADTLGAAQAMLDQAIAYAKERRQFNRPIGSFQAVKHMCAEMAAELEPCRSLVWYAAHSVRAIPTEARLMACHAKAHLSEVGQFVARTSTEVHGGMGFTDLLGLHYWFKRIGFNRQLLGAPELIREEAARVQGLVS